MLDNALIRLFLSVIRANQTIAGIPNLVVKQSFQPTQQGVNTVPTAYFSKLFDKRLGYPYRPNTWNQTPASTFTGSITGKVLTVTDVASGAVAIGQVLSGTGIDDSALIIIGLGSGIGDVGTYFLNQGFSLSSQTINGIPGEQIMTTQQYETTFQIMALSTQYPETPNAYTASDIVNAVAYCLQCDSAIETLENQGVGVLRVTDVRNPPFIDDRDRYEFGPSFDFTLTHKQIITNTIPVLETEEIAIYSI